MARPQLSFLLLNFSHQITEIGGFRCEVGDHIRPLSQLALQDGVPVCEDHKDEMSPIEARLALAASISAGAQHNDLARLWPAQALTSEFAGVPGITAISPTQLSLVHGGASGTLTLTGVNFSASDVITGTAGLTITPAVPSTVSIVITISAAGSMSAGLCSVVYNGQTLRGVVRVT